MDYHLGLSNWVLVCGLEWDHKGTNKTLASMGFRLFCQLLCKVVFKQPSCWLYSVPNLLVFQQLVTLYLGGIVVRVVSEIVWRNAQNCARKTEDSRLDLAGDSQLQAARRCTRARHARSWSVMLAGALQDKIGQLAILLSRGWISQLRQATS